MILKSSYSWKVWLNLQQSLAELGWPPLGYNASITLSNNASARLQRIKSQAIFPFKERTLLTLRENVHSLREDLQLALHVLHTDMEIQQKQNIANLAVVTRKVEMASQNTQSEVHAITTPMHRMNSKFDLLLQQGEDTKATLSNILSQTRQNHEIALEISEQYRQLLQRDRASSRSPQDDFCTSLVKFGAEQVLLRGEIEKSSQKREGEAEEMAARMDVLPA
ncbi:hypothetical protein G7Y79_00028g062170 [Physcia stellaris]|nr:hypothetical protein G7Y79_00028g062170 [Physcia stellaris]